MRCRWPFTAALVALVGGLGIAAAAPAVPFWLTPEEQREADLFRQAFARAEPAVELLVGMAPPDGTAPCHVDESISEDLDSADLIRRTHYICWEGQAEAVTATARLAANLRAVGATEVTPRCVERGPQRFIHCHVSASVLGESFVAYLGPRPEPGAVPARYTGVFISGGVGELLVPLPSRPQSGAPVPVPVLP